MKLYKLIILFAAFTFIIYSSSFAATVSGTTKLPPELRTNLPPGEIVEPLPEAILQDPPVYFDVDSKGNVWTQRLVVDKFGSYQFTDELVSQSRLDELTSQREVVLRNLENISLPGQGAGQGPSQASTSSCPLPSAFGIAGGSGQTPTGPIQVVNTYRPTGATTQWLVYDFYTTNYRVAASHMPMALFHDVVVHGWGAFIGDNHGGRRWDFSDAGCGDSSRFNSQIEAWTQYPNGAPPLGQPAVLSSRWQSSTFNGPVCGNEMYDGPVIINWMVNPRYRFEMQASTGHWVAYRIMELKTNPLRWEVLTDWRVTDVDSGNWQFLLDWSGPVNLPGPFNPQGIWIAATPGAIGASPWSINVFNTQCGWF